MPRCSYEHMPSEVPMPERRPLVVANWKMYLTPAESRREAELIRKRAAVLARSVEAVVCPSFPLLPDLHAIFFKSPIVLGAQDAHMEEAGPYTGDVSVLHLQKLVRYVIVGHSERRRLHGETDEIVARKMRRVLNAGMHPIVCVGETAEERAAEATLEVVRRQVGAVMTELPVLELPRIVFAYEPVWAIGTGAGTPAPQPAPGEAAEIIGFIRKVASDAGGRRYAGKLRILYGGSVTAKTAAAFMEPGVDGALVGGASTKATDFITIAQEIADAAR
jgi:triosephosphate isomerase (TIM)